MAARSTSWLSLLLILGACSVSLQFPHASAEALQSSQGGLGAVAAAAENLQGSETTFLRRKPLMAEDEEHPSSRKTLQGTQAQAKLGSTVAASKAAEAGKASGGAGGEGGALSTLKGLLTSRKGFLDAFLASLSMILVTEIGDETFIIAALMAMRHSRAIVLAGALSALAIMTVLSTGLGMIVPNLISRKATNQAAAALYTFFGLRLLYIAWRADPKDTPAKEMEEVEEKLEEDENGKGKVRAVKKFFASFCTPVFLEAFILTFLAEWGDRSQIATITLAAHKNAIGVTVGAILGHVVCTSVAVVGGRLLALKISQRTVAAVGGLLFLVFAVHSYVAPIADD